MRKLGAKDCRILIGAMNTGFRSLLQGVLFELGYTKVQTVSEKNILINRLETEDYDWVLMSIDWKDPLNGINILKMIKAVDRLKSVKVSFFISSVDRPYLTKAFELGAMSFHSIASTGEELKKIFTNFRERFEIIDDDYRLIAAQYLIEYLEEQGFRKDLLRFINALVNAYPTNTEALLMAADALIKCNRNTRALSLINQINLIDVLSSNRTSSLIEKTITYEDGSFHVPDIEPFPKLKRAMVVSSDREFLEKIDIQLQEFFIKPERFDPSTAFSMQTSGIDVIIIDWHDCPQSVSDLILEHYNSNERGIPIIGVFQEDVLPDPQYYRYLCITAAFVKPFTQAGLARALTYIVNTTNQGRHLYNFMFFTALNRNMKHAQILKSDYFHAAKPLAAEKDEIEAFLAVANQEYQRGKDDCYKALKHACDVKHVLAMLGVCLVREADYEGANLCFQHGGAPEISILTRLFELAKLKGSKEADKSPVVIRYATEFQIMKSKAALRTTFQSSGIKELLLALTYLVDDYPDICAEAFESFGVDLALNQYLPEARAALVKCTKLTKNDDVRKRCCDLIATLDDHINFGRPYKPKPEKVTPMNKNLERIIERAFLMSRADLCLEGLYVNQENKVKMDMLFDRVIKFEERTDFAQAYAYTTAKKTG